MGCTKAGISWATMALDPFHDFTLDHVGYPDSNEGLSVVICQQSELAVSAPPGSSGTWSCLVTTWPESAAGLGPGNTVSLIDTSTNANTIPVTGEGAGVLGPCSVYSFEEGVGGFDEALPTLNTSINVAAWIVQATLAHWNAQNVIGSQMDVLTTAPFRRIASGFEVANETPKLYQSGSVCVGRTTQINRLEEKISSNDTEATLEGGPHNTLIKENTVRRVDLVPTKDASKKTRDKLDTAKYSKERILVCEGMMPPATMALARSRPDSLLWEAHKGCYCVDTMIDDVNTAACEETVDHVFKNKDMSGGGTAIGYQHTLPATSGSATGACSVTHRENWNSSWAFFAGLSPQSVLRVTSKVYYEIFPSVFEAVLAGLAAPSPAYDPVALSLYFKASRKLPPGAPVGENAHGDWWRKALGLLETAAPVVASMPGWGPMASEGMLYGARVGRAVGPSIQSAVDKALAKRRNRRKK